MKARPTNQPDTRRLALNGRPGGPESSSPAGAGSPSGREPMNIVRRLLAPLALSVLAGLSLWAPAALAAAPETPAIAPATEVNSHLGVLRGFLNPGQQAGLFELDTYEFV